jgi:type IV pilus assembly protein PilC
LSSLFYLFTLLLFFMKRYRYKAKNEKGELITGEAEGKTIDHAAKLIRQKGLYIISITPVSSFEINVFKRFTNRISGGTVTTFTRQMATMINSGLPITEALYILRTQSNQGMANVVTKVLSDVEEGESLSSALAKHPRVFSKTYIALVKSGEVGGVLDEVLARLADDMERQQEFRGKIKTAMIYPVIIVIGMILVALVMLVVVIPRMLTLYEQFDVDLPIATKILIGVTTIMTKFWPLLLIGAGVAFWGFQLYSKTKDGRHRIDELILKIPIIGELQRQVILTDLTRTMSLMVGSGVSILEVLNISSSVSGNVVISDALNDTTKMVEKGFPLAFAFSRHPEAFPYILSQMISVGEETGKMDEVLGKISHIFEIESEQKLKALTAAIEPAILIVLGVGVAFMVIAIIMPIYNITTAL